MLRGIRKASSNWLGKAVMAAVMGLLIVSFAIWGIGDIFKGFGQSVVAKVGSRELSIEQFRSLYSERLQRLSREIGRPITPDQARAMRLDQQVLGQIITEMVLDERVRQMRLSVSDDEIARRLTQDPAFRGANGQFDHQRFLQLLRGAGYTESRFVAEQRRQMLRRQLGETLNGEIASPATVVAAYHRYQNEQRSIEYLVLGHAQAGDIPAPGDEVLAKYFEERKALFRAPEYRKLVVLSLTPGEIAQWISVSDEDAKRAYEDRRGRYSTPERRQIQQIVFSNLADAQASLDRLNAGLSFVVLAAERGLKETDIDLGLIPKSAIVDRAVAEAAFALKEGEVSAPIQGRFGVTLARVTKIVPEVVRSFEEVAPQIKREIAIERARAEIADRHDKIEDARAGGAQLTEIGQKVGLIARVIEAVDRSGRDPEGVAITDLPAANEVVQAAFASDIGVETDPIQVPGGGYVWVEVAGVSKSRDRTLDEIKARVETRWRDDQIAERLRAKSADMLAKLKAGTPFGELAAAETLKVETASELKRGKATEALSAKLIDEVFRIAKEAPGAAEGNNPTEWVIFRVTDIVVPALDPASDEAKQAVDVLQLL